ncbi:hypothetical protein [Amycolatopsis thermophila]|uniref:Uncharacterized protein n=1 Tax=Amycolatopsis thermophila TaxID=206084 RepID=A0ABU0ER89_9PSEU|nr:hypothetical protein [Amycolatopsis thermophila]MDQ0377511.1 hypothetical protein [Amycolatopsis thermophila]
MSPLEALCGPALSWLCTGGSLGALRGLSRVGAPRGLFTRGGLCAALRRAPLPLRPGPLSLLGGLSPTLGRRSTRRPTWELPTSGLPRRLLPRARLPRHGPAGRLPRPALPGRRLSAAARLHVRLPSARLTQP